MKHAIQSNAKYDVEQAQAERREEQAAATTAATAAAAASDESWFQLPSDYMKSIFGPTTAEEYVDKVEHDATTAENIDEAEAEAAEVATARSLSQRTVVDDGITAPSFVQASSEADDGESDNSETKSERKSEARKRVDDSFTGLTGTVEKTYNDISTVVTEVLIGSSNSNNELVHVLFVFLLIPVVLL
jgi:hypothetical protein